MPVGLFLQTCRACRQRRLPRSLLTVECQSDLNDNLSEQLSPTAPPHAACSRRSASTTAAWHPMSRRPGWSRLHGRLSARGAGASAAEAAGAR